MTYTDSELRKIPLWELERFFKFLCKNSLSSYYLCVIFLQIESILRERVKEPK